MKILVNRDILGRLLVLATDELGNSATGVMSKKVERTKNISYYLSSLGNLDRCNVDFVNLLSFYGFKIIRLTTKEEQNV